MTGSLAGYNHGLPDPQTSDAIGRVPSRAVVGVLIIVICCLLSTARLIVHTPAPSRLATPDSFTLGSDQRFTRLKVALPTHGIVGYVDTPGGSDNTANYYLAQYALAPLVVDDSPQHALVVGNFPANSVAARHLYPNLHLIQDFGNGVLLFANKDDR